MIDLKSLEDKRLEDCVKMGMANVVKENINLGKNRSAEAIHFSRMSKQVICITTQTSCKVGCVFCASPSDKPTYNLTGRNMLAQVIEMDTKYNNEPTKDMLISFMGEGEPLLNLQNVKDAIDKIDKYYNAKRHRFALSTSGVKPKQIKQLADFVADRYLRFKLQLSLHSAFTDTRTKIMPLTSATNEELLDAMNYFKNTTGAEIDINYMLIDGVNDSDNDALELFKQWGAFHLKISKYNSMDHVTLSPSNRVEAFCEKLVDLGADIEYHMTDGASVQAACGQTFSK